MPGPWQMSDRYAGRHNLIIMAATSWGHSPADLCFPRQTIAFPWLGIKQGTSKTRDRGTDDLAWQVRLNSNRTSRRALIRAVDPFENRKSFFKRSRGPRIKPHPEGLGKKADIKTFYESPTLDEYPGAINWVENDPPALPATKKLRFQGAAIHIYKRAQRDAGMYGNSIPFVADTVRLQSPYLRDMLDEVLEKHGARRNDYKGYTEITTPFEPLFYERERIQQLADTTDDPDAKEHLDLLVGVVQDVLASTLDQLEENETCGEVTYENLWTLFVPDEMAVCKCDGYDQGARIVDTTYGLFADDLEKMDKKDKKDTRDYCFIRTKRICFNGLQFGHNSRNFYIERFSGKKKIRDLEVCPLRLDKNPTATRQRFEDCGKRVLEYQDVEYALFRKLSGEHLEAASARAMNYVFRTEVSTQTLYTNRLFIVC